MRALLVAAVAVLAGCASAPVVAVKPGYDFSKLGRVALAEFHESPDAGGTGLIVSQALEPYLVKAGYNIVDRSQAAEADGTITGTVTSAVQARSSTYMQNVQSVRYQPVYDTVQYQGKDGRVRTRRQLGQYDVVTTNDQVPQTFTTDARIAFTARLISSSGEVLWTGSVQSEGDSLAAAAGDASEKLVKALKSTWPARP